MHFGNGSIAQTNSLSSYARGLTFKDHECHVSKLTLINGDQLPHLFYISDWVEDVSKYSPVARYIHVFGRETERVHQRKTFA